MPVRFSPYRPWTAAVAFAALLLAHSAILAEEQTAQPPYPEPPRGPRRGPEFGGFGGFGGGPPSHFGYGMNRIPDQPIETGYLFIEGQCLAPPYKIRLQEGSVTVNNRPLPCKPPEPDQGFARPDGFGRPDRRWESQNTDPWRRLALQLVSQLSASSVVMAFSDQPLVVLDGSAGAYDLFQRLTGEGKTSSKVELVDRLPDGFDERVWNTWLGSFTPSLGLRARAISLITTFDETDAEARGDVAANRWMSRLAYPLTLSGLLLAVLSIGHLLGGRPAAGKTAFEQDASPETLRALQYSLVLVGLLSLLDLAWTLIASQAGQMRELNPFGSTLIESPLLLAVFKIGVTGMSIGLLFALRKYRRAQVAAWWACLILTILAFRWLVFNSMYVSI
jgi:uncharacterized protein DUF5658